jgi:hypothetical protein
VESALINRLLQHHALTSYIFVQVELIVCIRAHHYRDALMYSQIILEKDPGNGLVAQFQPLLASLSVQANEPLNSDSDSEDSEGEEEGDNLTKYGKCTKADGLPWCGSFCNWVFHEAGVKLPSMVSTAAGAHKLKEVSRFVTTEPKIGDLAFMDFPHDGVDRISHIGIVVGVKSKTVITIEGNTSGTGDQRNGGQVCRKVRAYKVKNGGNLKKSIPVFIVGFGKPKFKD